MAHRAGRVKRAVRRPPGGAVTTGTTSILAAVLRRLTLTLVLLALLLVLGAGPILHPQLARDTVRSPVRSDAGGTPAPSPAATAACPPAGYSELDGGHIRMPSGATPAATRLLLAIMSGADGDAEDNLKLGAAANRQGIAVLYPTVRAGSIWELDDAMGDADVQTVTALLQRALATGCFDPDRVSIVGLSNGAGFANRLACKLPGQFAAVVSVAGGYRALDPCPPQERASFLAIHGSADQIVPYNGRKPDRKGNVPLFAAGWARRDGCSTTPATLHPRHLVTRLVFGGCPAGMRVEVLRLSGTDHGWPGAAPPWPRHNPSGVDANLEVMRWIRHAVRAGA
jgi:polyhydroxybutyrate depolymerase